MSHRVEFVWHDHECYKVKFDGETICTLYKNTIGYWTIKSEDLHNHILNFVIGLIQDLKARIRLNKKDTYWREEYREWLAYMQDAYDQLKAKEPI